MEMGRRKKREKNKVTENRNSEERACLPNRTRKGDFFAQGYKHGF